MSLQVWLPLNRDLRNQGLKGVDVVNNGVTFSDGCANFNSSYISMPAQITSNTSNFTIAAWVYVSYLSGDYGPIYNSRTSTDGNGVVLWMVTTGFRMDDGAEWDLNYSYPTNTWIHVCYTRDESKKKLYVNGELVGEANSGNLANINTTAYIGKDQLFPTTYYLNGKISDFRIYNHTLSEKEVRELSRGCILHYPCNDIINESTVNLITSLSSHLNVTINDKAVITTGQNVDTCFIINLSESISIGTQYTISCEANLPENTYWDFPLGAYENTALTWRIKPGYNEYTFIANNISWGVNCIFIDDLPSPARESGVVCKFYNFQLEKKDHATPYTPTSRIFPYLMDKSGFDNHSTISGSLPLATGSPRYKQCMNIEANNYAQSTLKTPQVKSCSFWVYIGSTFPTKTSGTNQLIIFIDMNTDLAFGFHGGNACSLRRYTSGRIVCDYIINDKVKYDSWNHFACNNTGTDTELWLNGVKITNGTSGLGFYITSQTGFVLGDNGDALRFTGQVSDFRLFSRVLTQADVNDLYHDVTIIDNNQNEFTYELNEIDNQSTIDITPDGLLKCRIFYEANIDTYDNTIYSEPDGSLWVRIFHHNNPANALFSSSDTFTTGVYKDKDRWFKVSLCDKVSQWELMVKQKAESTTTNESKWRWIQNVNPMTAVYGDVDLEDITRITTGGYSTWWGNYGGIYYSRSSMTYITHNKGIESSWYGAIGSWSLYEGGIPASNQVIVTTGYMDLYLRIDNLSEEEQLSLFTTSEDQVMRFGPNAVNSTNELNEI